MCDPVASGQDDDVVVTLLLRAGRATACASALLAVAAIAACGGEGGGSPTDTTPEAVDPVQETAAGEDVRERSVVIQLTGEVTGSATLAPTQQGTRVTVQLAEGAEANGGAVVRGGCDGGEEVAPLEVQGTTFDGTIPQTLDELLEGEAIVAVEVRDAGGRLACGEGDAQQQ